MSPITDIPTPKHISRRVAKYLWMTSHYILPVWLNQANIPSVWLSQARAPYVDILLDQRPSTMAKAASTSPHATPLIWYEPWSLVRPWTKRLSGGPWWRHQMETFSALLAICAGNSPVTGEFPTQRPVTRSFDVVFYLRLNKRLSKQSWGWWFETPSHPLWGQCNAEQNGRHFAYNIWYLDWNSSKFFFIRVQLST